MYPPTLMFWKLNILCNSIGKKGLSEGRLLFKKKKRLVGVGLLSSSMAFLPPQSSGRHSV
jgi:hypothetical protein